MIVITVSFCILLAGLVLGMSMDDSDNDRFHHVNQV